MTDFIYVKKKSHVSYKCYLIAMVLTSLCCLSSGYIITRSVSSFCSVTGAERLLNNSFHHVFAASDYK